ncbi:tRNA pseudouridine(38-40) synthase TruA [Nocardioides lianchengensis]|uniref:tRNA pseudouridine synthase A n=1 Tax=Nocardioides lianchengensis TaxID=1045774 RepID=A0A1G6IGL8_9ACTN|nr:tRNA pseudouridine(38-40) synthase TruA [Nocardioides lianchengensis]NYG13062.1 tRNA pseudouridine38-40 synthase [Nocardioides lianchengensis]SDC05155.1 tRNA pseudouridine38-40 synthase [Nocardioides lianchengensis]
MRIRIDLAYDGTDFRGWATQPGLRTVQETLGSALATVLRVDRVDLVCAGRTDAGVHARGQVVHVDLAEEPDLDRLVRRLNGVLPPDVRVRRAAVAADGFDARFSALWRRYAYRIADRSDLLDPLTRSHVLAWPRPLDEELMNQASATLVGQQDFASFCKQREGATTIRTLLDLTWTRTHGGLLVGTVRADAFCHSMVRALVGCLVAVGEGRKPVEWAAEMLHAQRRDPAVAVLHAHGLTLEEVAYPVDDELAARNQLTRAKRT